MADTILEKDITAEMRASYLDYSMSVITGRAIPDIKDGLKPVHRRILYSMWEQGMTHDSPYRKSARAVGDILGKYHAHGDTSVYDSIVRMAQQFSMRYPLIDGQGNFGSIDGDPAAAMRYTEVRLSKIANEILIDLNKNTIDFIPNYDNTLQEPVVLPSKLPNLLLNGSSGIAVGYASNIPPHNIKEVVDAITLTIDNPDISHSDLMKAMPAPDFPTGGIIMGRGGLVQAYQNGRGPVTLRGKASIEDGKRHQSIIITEIPYQVNKATLTEKIADLVKSDTITGISEIRDESDREGIRLVLEIKKDVDANIILNQLYKYTDLEITFNINMVVLIDGVPKTVSLKTILQEYIKHREAVITRRTQFDLTQAEKRIHILKGLVIALQNIDEVVKLIKGSESPASARDALIKQFSLSEEQTKAILDMKLHRLTSLEQGKISSEVAELETTISRLKLILLDRQEVLKIIKEELTSLKNEYGDARRTEINDIAPAENITEIEDLIQPEDVIVTITADGYIKRQPEAAYKAQGRGGKGSKGADIKSEDCVIDVFGASTRDYLMAFTNFGKAHWLKVYEIPQVAKNARGKSILSLLKMEKDEKVVSLLPVRDFQNGYIMAVLKSGNITRMSVEEFANPRNGGIKAINLIEDELISVKKTNGNNDIIIATRFGKAIRFNENDIRPTGRFTRGIRGIKLGVGDEVISMDTINGSTSLLTITTSGMGKRTEISEYMAQARGGGGVLSIRLTRNFVCGVLAVKESDEILVTTKNGIMMRMPVSDIRDQGRATQGLKIMDVSKDDEVTAITKLGNDDADLLSNFDLRPGKRADYSKLDLVLSPTGDLNTGSE
jgi:DNA gyrase subunit A